MTRTRLINLKDLLDWLERQDMLDREYIPEDILTILIDRYMVYGFSVPKPPGRILDLIDRKYMVVGNRVYTTDSELARYLDWIHKEREAVSEIVDEIEMEEPSLEELKRKIMDLLLR